MCVCIPKPAKLILIELRCWNFRAYSLCLIFLDLVLVLVLVLSFLFSNTIFLYWHSLASGSIIYFVNPAFLGGLSFH